MVTAKPKLFIGSSAESLECARAVADNLADACFPIVWEHAFPVGTVVLDELLKQLNEREYDFGLFIFGADDIAIIRDRPFVTTRDNVVFELGLFMAKLGRDHTFVVAPEIPDFRLPSDLFGLVWTSYDPLFPNGTLKPRAMMAKASNAIRQTIRITLELESKTAATPGELKPIRGVRKALASRSADPKVSEVERQFNKLLLSKKPADLDKAVVLLRRKALQKAEHYNNVAYLYWEMGRLEQAIEIGEQGLDLAQRHAPQEVAKIQNNLAYYCADANDPAYEQVARKYAQAAYDSDPGHAGYIDTLGYVKITFGKSKQEVREGMALCKKAQTKGTPGAALSKHIARAKLRLQAVR